MERHFYLDWNFVISLLDEWNLDPTKAVLVQMNLIWKEIKTINFWWFAGQDQVLENLKVFIAAANQEVKLWIILFFMGLLD
jgi:Holliday junction resolvasome RuvABC ATP-dependent DNA helicase subunit